MKQSDTLRDVQGHLAKLQSVVKAMEWDTHILALANVLKMAADITTRATSEAKQREMTAKAPPTNAVFGHSREWHDINLEVFLYRGYRFYVHVDGCACGCGMKGWGKEALTIHFWSRDKAFYQIGYTGQARAAIAEDLMRKFGPFPTPDQCVKDMRPLGPVVRLMPFTVAGIKTLQLVCTTCGSVLNMGKTDRGVVAYHLKHPTCHLSNSRLDITDKLFEPYQGGAVGPECAQQERAVSSAEPDQKSKGNGEPGAADTAMRAAAEALEQMTSETPPTSAASGNDSRRDQSTSAGLGDKIYHGFPLPDGLILVGANDPSQENSTRLQVNCSYCGDQLRLKREGDFTIGTHMPGGKKPNGEVCPNGYGAHRYEGKRFLVGDTIQQTVSGEPQAPVVPLIPFLLEPFLDVETEKYIQQAMDECGRVMTTIRQLRHRLRVQIEKDPKSRTEPVAEFQKQDAVLLEYLLGVAEKMKSGEVGHAAVQVDANVYTVRVVNHGFETVPIIEKKPATNPNVRERANDAAVSVRSDGWRNS